MMICTHSLSTMKQFVFCLFDELDRYSCFGFKERMGKNRIRMNILKIPFYLDDLKSEKN